MADVFISYAHQDRARIEVLGRLIEREGWSVWFDRELRPGEEFRLAIDRQLRAARCVVVVWSRSSVASVWVCAEAQKALRRRVLVPVCIDDAEPPMPFGELQTIFLTKTGTSELLTQLRRILGGIAHSLATEPANHAELLCAGVRAWNEWRAANPQIEPNLAGADLRALDLAHANLSGVNAANADFSLAILEAADCRKAIFAGAILAQTRLRRANFRNADLTRADLHRAVFDNTILLGARLAGAKHLESTVHLDTSHLDQRALAKSPGLAAHFLRGCGMTDSEIAAYDHPR